MKYWLALLAALAALPAQAEIYKCRLSDGRTEISNKPCPEGSATVLSHPDDVVPEARRREAEREVERMQRYLEKQDARQRAAADAARDREEDLRRAQSVTPPARADDGVEECLRAIDQQILGPEQRATLEAQCRQRDGAGAGAAVPAAPIRVPETLYAPDAARRRQERERGAARREPPRRDAKRAAPDSRPSSVCPPDDKNCWQGPRPPSPAAARRLY